MDDDDDPDVTVAFVFCGVKVSIMVFATGFAKIDSRPIIAPGVASADAVPNTELTAMFFADATPVVTMFVKVIPRSDGFTLRFGAEKAFARGPVIVLCIENCEW